MKKPTEISLKLVTSIALGLALWTTAAATAGEIGDGTRCSPALWPEVKKLAQSCLSLRNDGQDCQDIEFQNARSASFEIGGVRYSAELSDSDHSDGGDLNDVRILAETGCELQLSDVPAEGDLLSALASVQSR